MSRIQWWHPNSLLCVLVLHTYFVCVQYTRYLESQNVEEARAVFKRACEIHLTRRPNIYMQWATFEERHGMPKHTWLWHRFNWKGFTEALQYFRVHFLFIFNESLFQMLTFHIKLPFFSPILREGNLTEARRVLAAIEKTVPGLAVVRLRRVALERRAGQLDRSEALLQEAVAESKEKPTLHAFYSIKLARLLLKLGRNPSKARKVLQEALEISPVRLTFILKQYFHLSLHHMHIVSHTHRHRIPTRLNPLFLSLE